MNQYGNEPQSSPQIIADNLLAHAIHLDDGKPSDDISIIVIKVVPHRGDPARRMLVRLPLNDAL